MPHKENKKIHSVRFLAYIIILTLMKHLETIKNCLWFATKFELKIYKTKQFIEICIKIIIIIIILRLLYLMLKHTLMNKSLNIIMWSICCVFISIEGIFFNKQLILEHFIEKSVTLLRI